MRIQGFANSGEEGRGLASRLFPLEPSLHVGPLEPRAAEENHGQSNHRTAHADAEADPDSAADAGGGGAGKRLIGMRQPCRDNRSCCVAAQA